MSELELIDRRLQHSPGSRFGCVASTPIFPSCGLWRNPITDRRTMWQSWRCMVSPTTASGAGRSVAMPAIFSVDWATASPSIRGATSTT